MYRPLGILLLVTLCSFATYAKDDVSLKELVASNQSKLIKLSLGMTKNEVIELMGTITATTHDGVVNNPWIAESFMDKDGTPYEVLFYVTKKNQPFTPIRKALTTPVVLKDGKVIGWGESALRATSAKGAH